MTNRTHTRRVQRSPAERWFWLSVGLVIVLALLLILPSYFAHRPGSTLTLYCAAALRPPMETVVAEYQREHGVRVKVQYGGSNTLLGQIEVHPAGDLFLPADESYLRLAESKGLVDQWIPLATMRPVLAVAHGNPRGIRTLADVVTTDARIVLPNPDQTAVGNKVREVLRTQQLWEGMHVAAQQRGVFKPTVGDAANDLLLGSADAGFLWDVVVAQYAGLEVVDIPELREARVQFGVAILGSSINEGEAKQFARYLSAPDHGLQVFSDFGYVPVESNR